MTQDERLGYISARVESLQSEVLEFKEMHKDHCEKEDEDRKAVLERLDTIAEKQTEIVTELTVYKRIGQFLIGTVAFLSAISFDNIAKLISRWF